MFDFALYGHVTLDKLLSSIDDKLSIYTGDSADVESKLFHFEEANLYHLDYVKDLTGVKTCDLSSTGLALHSEIANEFDFVFVTPEQTQLIPETFNRRLVVHGPKETIVYKAGEKIAEYKTLDDELPIDDGKYFIACYIYGTIHGRDDTHCAEMSHRLNLKYLKDRQTQT
jgi:hypothetical protein